MERWRSGEDNRKAVGGGERSKISAIVMDDFQEEQGEQSEQREDQLAMASDMQAFQNEIEHLNQFIAFKDDKIQRLKIERFEFLMRMVFALSEVERVRNQYVPF